MKRILLTAAVAGILPLVATAQAADGTINFTGSILGTTCTINVNGVQAPAAAAVSLAPAGDSLLNTMGKTAAPTAFDIQLSACTATGKAYAYFEGGSGADPLTGLLINTGSATRVALQLLDRSPGAPVPILAGQSQTATTRINIVGGAASLPYSVQYYALGAATVGTVRGSVTYTIRYE